MRFAPPQVDLEHHPDGTLLLRSSVPLAPYDRCVGDWLVRWATQTPDRVFLAERVAGAWHTLTYRDTLAQARRVGESLLSRGLTADRPVAILSENSVNHALVALGAMHAGIPVAPISPAYSLASTDHARLNAIAASVGPGLVFAEPLERFANAISAIGAKAITIDELLACEPTARVDAAFAAITSDTIAKILFTSGSTGAPKGVINTQRMLCASQQSWAQMWPFVEAEPPVMCDWLPWHHTVGGNAGFNLILRNGGTLYIDDGRPTPDRIAKTADNLRDVRPTLAFNVPRGFELLLPILERDDTRQHPFFARLEVIYNTAAALPPNLWNRLRALAEREGGRAALVAGWGSTEMTLATRVHATVDRSTNIGTPGPGVEIKLVVSGDKREARVRGPNVMPGCYRAPEFTAAAFDEDGFYITGDALTLDDPADPSRGLIFDGRVAEHFKLSSGTWVHTAAVRLTLIAACEPLVQDAVITGHDRTELGALLFLNHTAVQALQLSPDDVRNGLRDGLRRLRTNATGGTTTIARLLIAEEPPSLDANEITDKGQVNQRAVLARRHELVDRLYSNAPDVIAI